MRASGADERAAPAKKLRLLVVDDHEVVRQGVRALLESSGEIEVVGEAANATEALARILAEALERIDALKRDDAARSAKKDCRYQR